MHINLVYDPSVADAPPAFKTALDAAAHALDSLIVDPIRVNIEVGYGEIEGQPLGFGPRWGAVHTWIISPGFRRGRNDKVDCLCSELV